MDNKLILNTIGYYEVENKPSKEELERFYSEKYFQNHTGQYQRTYSEEELVFFRSKARVCIETLKLNDIEVKSVFEIGCGEGFFANEFYKKEINILLNDYSSAGLEAFHPHLVPFLEKKDVYEHLHTLSLDKKTFSLISMDNVLEHVLDPKMLMASLKEIMDAGSVLRITVPNDFSAYQDMLLKNKQTTNTWVCPPEHLNYFNSKNLKMFCEAEGFKVISVQCDFPIEIFLSNPHSNYCNDRNLGKAAHKSRVECTNYMIDQNIDAYIQLSEAAAQLQFGRGVTIYLTL